MEIIFTEHTKERMRKRSISEEEVINAIKFADKTDKKQGKYYTQKNIGRAEIGVVYEKDKYIKVITTYYL